MGSTSKAGASIKIKKTMKRKDGNVNYVMSSGSYVGQYATPGQNTTTYKYFRNIITKQVIAILINQDIRKINAFFKTAIKPEIDDIVKELSLTELQLTIFYMRYIQRQNINFIADNLLFSKDKINNELAVIRKKILKVL